MKFVLARVCGGGGRDRDRDIERKKDRKRYFFSVNILRDQHLMEQTLIK